MPPILQEIKAYFKTRLDLLKYETIDRGAAIIAELIADLLIGLSLLMSFIFFTIALAFFLAVLFKSYWTGFGLVSLLYLLILFLGNLLKTPLQNNLIRVFLIKSFKKR